MDVEDVLSHDYSTQHFGIHPRHHVDNLYNLMQEAVINCMNDFKKNLGEAFPDVISNEELRARTDKLFLQYQKFLDFGIDKLETYLDATVFDIPDHIVLPEDEVHAKISCTKEEYEQLVKDVEILGTQILQERFRKERFKSKIKEQKALIEELEELKMQLVNINSAVKQTFETPNDLKAYLEEFKKLQQYLDTPQLFKSIADESLSDKNKENLKNPVNDGDCS